MIRVQKDGYRLVPRVEHGLRMAQNDDIEGRADVPALFADITALLEDAHEIATRGQNSKLERVDYLSEVGELRKILNQIGFLSESILSAR